MLSTVLIAPCLCSALRSCDTGQKYCNNYTLLQAFQRQHSQGTLSEGNGCILWIFLKTLISDARMPHSQGVVREHHHHPGWNHLHELQFCVKRGQANPHSRLLIMRASKSSHSLVFRPTPTCRPPQPESQKNKVANWSSHIPTELPLSDGWRRFGDRPSRKQTKHPFTGCPGIGEKG